MHENFDPDGRHGWSAAVFVIGPGVDLEFNLVMRVKPWGGASCRYTSDLNLPKTSKDAMWGSNALKSIWNGVF